MAQIELLSVVALVEDRLDKGLVRGQVGTVVENLAPGVYEVEFIDESGQTYASFALHANQLMRLHHEPSHQAA
jgi:hypothetical protein